MPGVAVGGEEGLALINVFTEGTAEGGETMEAEDWFL
jgi:hypothetical protein